MGYPKGRATLCFLTFVLLGCNRTAYASFDEVVPGQDRRGCGDYTILSDARDRAVFNRHCGTNKERDFKLLRNLVNRLDPKREARAAALRGDFRLAAVTDGGPPRPDQKRFWYTEGVSCENVNDSEIFIWARQSDALIPGGSHSGYQSDMSKFARAYNISIISEARFPSDRNCTTNP